MKILIFRKTSFKYFGDHFREDDFKLLGDFLEGFHPSDTTFLEWMKSDEEGSTITDSLLLIEKNLKTVTITDFSKKDNDSYPIFCTSPSLLMKLAEDIYILISKEIPPLIAIMYENNKYYLKPFFLSIIAFRRLMQEEFNIPEGRYVMNSFEEDNELAALGMCLESTSEIYSVIQWLEDSELVWKYQFGSLKKIEDEIIIEYQSPHANWSLTTTIKTYFLKKIIEYYINFVNQKIEGFLLIKTTDGYSFMINPHQEIKLT